MTPETPQEDFSQKKNSVDEKESVSETEISFAERKYKLKTALLAINSNDEEIIELIDPKVQKALEIADRRISRLEKQYPGDKDIRVLRSLYNDLKEDFDNSRELNLDSSFDKLLGEIKQEIFASGVKRESIEDTILANMVRKLGKSGIKPDYVVTKGNPSAKTVVYFAQVHPKKDMSDESMKKLGVTYSQDQIFKAITAAVKKGLIRDIYGESISHGVEVSKKIVGGVIKRRVSPDINFAIFKAKSELGEKIKLLGIEDQELLYKSIKTGKDMVYRMTAHNILLASNLANSLNERDQSLSFIILGAGHEKNLLTNEGHPLPFSEVLAYYGLNVIVVDTSQRFNIEALLKHSKEMEKNRDVSKLQDEFLKLN